MFRRYNANPAQLNVGDCTVRAISKATGESWDKTFIWLCVYGFDLKDMQDANRVWGKYLKDIGFRRIEIPDTCPDCYTVKHFCRDFSKGTYILALASHVIAVIDGDYFDTWDSGNELPIYVWRKDD